MKKRVTRNWTDAEQSYLIKNWNLKTSYEIAETLNRSIGAIKARAFTLDLTSSTAPKSELSIAELKGLRNQQRPYCKFLTKRFGTETQGYKPFYFHR